MPERVKMTTHYDSEYLEVLKKQAADLVVRELCEIVLAEREENTRLSETLEWVYKNHTSMFGCNVTTGARCPICMAIEKVLKMGEENLPKTEPTDPQRTVELNFERKTPPESYTAGDLALQNSEFRKALAGWLCECRADGKVELEAHRPDCNYVRVEKKISETKASAPDPFVACGACGAPKLCACGHPVAMHRPSCFWSGVCGCKVKLSPELVALAIARDEHPHGTPQTIKAGISCPKCKTTCCVSPRNDDLYWCDYCRLHFVRK
jgi:hypothetical protein